MRIADFGTIRVKLQYSRVISPIEMNWLLWDYQCKLEAYHTALFYEHAFRVSEICKFFWVFPYFK